MLIDSSSMPDLGSLKLDPKTGKYFNDFRTYDDADDEQFLGGSRHSKVYAGGGNDKFYLQANDDWADGGPGNDYFDGGSGSDTIYGGIDNDDLRGSQGKDYLYGGIGNDTLYGMGVTVLSTDPRGSDAGNYLEGNEGNDELYGATGNDTMYGGTGDDYLDGWEGDDYLYGGDTVAPDETGTGNDVLVAWMGNDKLYGGDGDDWLDGSYDDDELYGGDDDDKLGNAYLQGEAGNDKMYGGRGNDELYGGDGDDLLNGYGGNFYERDTLMGGANADQFILGTETAFYFGDGNGGYATIVDFQKSQGDKIQVYGIKDNYKLDTSLDFSGSSALDTAIFYKNDLIGVVEDKTYTSRSELLTFVV